MDHLAVQCKKKLETFRIKELKDVLSRIGGRKQGKKQVLVDKIMAMFLSAEMGHPVGPDVGGFSTMNLRSREAVAKIVDDVYRSRCFSAPDLATTSMIDQGIRDSSFQSVQPKLPTDGWQYTAESKIRCPCGNKMEFGEMIQCDVLMCLTKQHVNCVILPEREDVKPEIPSKFSCEVCRIQQGDPFCVSVAHPLMPVKTFSSLVYLPEGGASVMQSMEKSFTLTHRDQQLLQYPEYDLQIWCVLLGDKVAFRMHWPLKSDLRVNGASVRVTNRPAQQKLGANGRDDGPLITNYTREGSNRISFTAYDDRSFCLGVRILCRLTIDQVLCQIPCETKGESLNVALARVQRCISGGAGVGDDSDSDLEVLSKWVTVSLCCPLSGSRIRVAGRFRMCMHMSCFDLHTFVQLNQRTRKWQCPSCLKNYSLKDLIIDPFFTQVARALESYDEDVKEVEIKADGSWRPKLDNDVKFNESWRSPLGLLMTDDLTNAHVALSLEDGSVEHPGFNSKHDGIWKASGPAVSTISDMMGCVKNGIRSQSSIASMRRQVSRINQEPMGSYSNVEREEVEVSSCLVDIPSSACCNGSNLLDEDIDLPVTKGDNLAAFNIACEEYCSSNPLELQENERALLPRGNAIEPALEEVHGSCLTEPLDFLGVCQELSRLPAPTDCETESQFGSSSFLNITQKAFMDQSTCGLDSSTVMEACVLNVPINEFPQEINPLDASTNRCTETADGLLQGYQNLCNEEINELEASDLSVRDFLPHQPARSMSNITEYESRDLLTDNMHNGWFSLSLGGSESLNSAAAALYKPAVQKTQSDPLIESASLLLELSQYQRRVDESCIGSKRIEGRAICSSDPYQRNFFCIDSDSD